MMRNLLKIGFVIFSMTLCGPVYAEYNWTWTIGCPESGTTSPTSTFTATTSVGFSGTGTCQRMATGFTELIFLTNNNTVNSSIIYGVQSADMLLLPPILNWETKPIVVLPPECPTSSRTLNWIVFQWKQDYRHDLDGIPVMGVSAYDTSTGLSLSNAYDADGDLMVTGPIALTGSCSSGTYTMTGNGDRGGQVKFSANGAGYFSALSEKKYFFMPQYTVNAATDLGSSTFSGYAFNSTSASATKPVVVTSDAAGTTWTIQAYSDAGAGTIDASYTDTITISSTNSPGNGFMLGSLTRTGAGAGTGAASCIVSKGVATRVSCAIESPNDNTIPYSLMFAKEGPQVLGQASGTSVTGGSGLNTAESVATDGTRLVVADTSNHRVLIWNSIPSSDQVEPDLVLGQPDLYSATANIGGRSAQTMSSPRGVYVNGGKLFVADSSNHRVLIWNTFPTTNQQAADVVLGQTAFTTASSNQGGRSAATLNTPYSVSGDGTRLYVADHGNNRVLIWNSIPTVNKTASDVVLGQPNFTVATANNGGISAQTLSSPRFAGGDGTRVYVSDSANNRALIWNSVPSSNQTAADVVLGQPDFASSTANNGGRSAQTLSAPRGIYSNGTKLFVTDPGNHRTLIWNTMPTVNQTAADVVLGQTLMTSGGANSGGRTASTANSPRGITSDGTKLFLLDTSNFRLLSWNAIPTVNATAANNVQGQPNMSSGTANAAAVTSTSIANPQDVFYDGTHLIVADTTNNRVLIWNQLPSGNQAAADIVLGQPDMESSDANNGGRSAQTLSAPAAVYSNGTYLVVSDSGNHRVLIWNTFPVATQEAADVVLGQTDFSGGGTNAGGRSSSSLNSPQGLHYDGTKLYVADASNNRVLIWNTFPTVNKQAADVVLGQANFAGGTANSGGRSAQTMSTPRHAFSNGSKLVVTDNANHRVLIWNTIPTVNQTAADVVVGQADMTSGSGNSPSRSAATLSGPYGAFFTGTRLLVSDTGNHRVLLYNTIPTSNGASADYQFGQTDFTTATANAGGLSSSSMNSPRRIWSNGTSLFVADATNNRVIGLDLP